jgi:hopanoid biosynthesis associated protein HpnK
VSRLIVNADDFGLTAGVNRAISELNAAGLLTSASLMARETATDAAIELARNMPALSVGCHVVLADGVPVSPASEIPTLIDRKTGRFPVSIMRILTRLFTGRLRGKEIEMEAAAQIRSLQQQGIRLTHVDTHKHTHMFPPVLRPVLRAARAAGIRAVRNPFEPEWAVRATTGAPLARVAQITGLRRMEPVWRRILAEEGFKTTDGTIAMVGTGVLNDMTLRSLLTNLPEGTWELVTHPGYNDADLDKVRTRLRDSRDVERGALAVLREFPGIERISFADL